MDSFLEKYDIVNVFKKCIGNYLGKTQLSLSDIKVESINNVYHLKYYYEKSQRQHMTTTIVTTSKFEELLGYFEEVDNGYIFISCDISHNWKRFRTSFLEDHDNVIVIGEHLLFLDNKEIELDKRYYFKNIENSFYFKSKVAKVGDMYMASKTSERYFVFRDSFYASSDYCTNSYTPAGLFKNMEMTNEHIFMLLSVSNHQSVEQIENTYRDKVYKKLLKV